MTTTTDILYITSPGITHFATEIMLPIILLGLIVGVVIAIVGWIAFEIISKIISIIGRDNGKPAHEQ